MSGRQPKLFANGTMGPLIDAEIQEYVERGLLIQRDTFKPTSLEASSYDIRVGAKGVLGGEGREIPLDQEAMELTPGAYGGVISLERLALPKDIYARIGSKRALSYEGVILLTGSLVDPGYEGHLLFGLYNASQRRVLIRQGRKICNVVFERLPQAPEKQAPSDPDLRTGNFPDAFIDRMANMEVLPWMQISERVKQIEQITADILDLKARYEDVLKPIRDLTENVQSLTKDVTTLTAQTSSIATDVNDLNKMVSENSRQVSQLTTNLATIVTQIGTLQTTEHAQGEQITTLRTTVGRFNLLIYGFWALLILGLGSVLPTIFKKLFGS
jgi:deoxycytidine triphosphate deaminase